MSQREKQWNKATVSVHIVTYNSAEDIESCLQAVLQQTYSIEQIIVVDNQSSDGTRSILERYRKDITVIENKENTGFAGGHNTAIAHSQSDFFVVLNPDVTLSSTYIEDIIVYMNQHPEAGSATGKLLSKHDEQIIDSTGIRMNALRRAVDRGTGERMDEWGQSQEIFGASGAAAVYARRMVEDVSYLGAFFDPDFFAYKEDVDVAWRSRLLGWKAYYVASALAYHERGWKTAGRSAQSRKIRKHSYINRYRMMMLNDSGALFMRHLPKILAFELIQLGYILLREPFLLTAWRDFFRDLSKMRAKRTYIKSRTKTKPLEVYRTFQL